MLGNHTSTMSEPIWNCETLPCSICKRETRVNDLNTNDGHEDYCDDCRDDIFPPEDNSVKTGPCHRSITITTTVILRP